MEEINFRPEIFYTISFSWADIPPLNVTKHRTLNSRVTTAIKHCNTPFGIRYIFIGMIRGPTFVTRHEILRSERGQKRERTRPFSQIFGLKSPKNPARARERNVGGTRFRNFEVSHPSCLQYRPLFRPSHLLHGKQVKCLAKLN